MLKITANFVFLFLSLNLYGFEKIPKSININGEFHFLTIDNNGNLRREVPPAEIGISSCTLNIVAKDDELNYYPATFELRNVEDFNSLPIFNLEMRYLDANGNYKNRQINQLSFQVANIKANDTTWFHQMIRNKYALLDPELQAGVEAFHHLTMGQAMRINFTVASVPSEVRIDVSPLNAKLAMKARKCLKMINGDK